MIEEFISKIVTTPVFAGISEGELLGLLAKHNCQIRQFSPDTMIMQSGEEVNNLLLLIEGTVKGEMIDFSGKTIKIEDIDAPAVLASAFIFGRKSASPVNIVSVTDTRIFTVSRETLVAMMQDNKRILINFLNSISSRSQFLAAKIRFLGFKTIREKIAHYILAQMKHDVHTVELPVGQKELSELFGVARPSLARALGEMEKDGLIQVHRREIRIVNKDTLAELLRT
ncbi:MAG: Crp/Fnr family transcriptional regulator [Bacteroidetes bacterium]|nr:Crp/Fnr family transcriptional regulator [Bacteroidota bacterium]MBU1718986.1 Crp/Fnr family transcriptional regulator [Bacteroidota bacterium]